LHSVESQSDFATFEVKMDALQSQLKQLYDRQPNARYYNMDIVKNQRRPAPGAQNAPLHLVSYWKCDDNPSLKVDFKYHHLALAGGGGQAQPLKNVSFSTNIDHVVSMVSQPEGHW